MKSIQEIFSAEFSNSKLAVIQKLRSNERNLKALNSGYTESWPPLPSDRAADIFVLAISKIDESKVQEIWAGFINDCQPSTENRFRFYVDRFRFVGEHNLAVVSDADFYGHGGGGGSRNYAFNLSQKQGEAAVNLTDWYVPEGENERRLVWIRKNHDQFRDPVWAHWEGKCAVTRADCNGLLVASHIHPWAKSTPKEKTDPHNGLLLSVPLDKLFDRGWISFLGSGEMLIKPLLSEETRFIFGLQENMSLDISKVSEQMAAYLARHRTFHAFE